MMQVVIDKNKNIDKEIIIIKSLEVSIEQDKNKNDLKSLKYHSMALKEHKKILNELQNKEELEITL